MSSDRTMCWRSNRRATGASRQPIQLRQNVFPDDPERAARAGLYLRENVRYALGEPEIAGLRQFYQLAAEVGVLASADTPAVFY